MICKISSLRPVRVTQGFERAFPVAEGKGLGSVAIFALSATTQKLKDEAVTLISDTLATFFYPLG